MPNCKNKTHYGTFLHQGLAEEHARMKCATAVSVEWRSSGMIPVKVPAFDPETADEVDPFDMMDLIGSGSPESKGGEAAAREGELYEAPCHKCPIDTCWGTYGECVLNSEPDLALGLSEGEEYNDQDNQEV